MKNAGLLCLVLGSAMLLHGCASESSTPRPGSMGEMRQVLEAVGAWTDTCGEEGALSTVYGNALSSNFRREYEVDHGCTADVYWYEYVHVEKGRGYAWSTDIDRLNNGLRRLHETNELRRVIEGPNFFSETTHEGTLPSYLDAMYNPGAYPPPLDSVRYDVDEVTNTIWDAVDQEDRLLSFRFFPNGKVHVYSGSGVSENATWQQDGSTVFVEVNDRYVEHYGSIDGDTMTGNSWNARGDRWTWTAERRSSQQ